MKTIRLSPPLAGLVQAAGLVLYVLLFSWFSTVVGPRVLAPFMGPQLLGMALFLLAFCTSALICSTLVFGYPLMLVLHKQWKTGLQVFLWTVGWVVLLGLLLVLLTITMLIGTPTMMY